MSDKLEKHFSVSQTDYNRVTIYYDHPEQVPDDLTVERFQKIIADAEEVAFPCKKEGIIVQWDGVADYGDTNYGAKNPVFDIDANQILPHAYNFSLTSGSAVLWERIKDIGEYELREIMMAYDQYVAEISSRDDGGSIPVCLAEYIDCEWEIFRNGGGTTSAGTGHSAGPAEEMLLLSAADAIDYFIIGVPVWKTESTGETIKVTAAQAFKGENDGTMYGITKEDYFEALESEWSLKDWSDDVLFALENSGRCVADIEEILDIRDEVKRY
jgi:hypothetical protein